MLQIDSGILMPTDRTAYPFREMEPGDSILFKDPKRANSARVSALRFVKTYEPDWTFKVRKVADGWRLWRVS